ncbi:hypothetical protein VP01_3640g1 [Puccinia sorghi]|uniref:HAT C-terminal dimerisation domain-containing protein n=1 Tax=Puccinia sorghi TaxID=27349 RepID=A0A0L6UUR4_9BASI|nr:hypothetical protein VP01_3640g1 [Puccinia sorghi]
MIQKKSNELNKLTKAHDFLMKEITGSSGDKISSKAKIVPTKQEKFVNDFMLCDEQPPEVRPLQIDINCQRPFNNLTKIMEGDGPIGASDKALERGAELCPMYHKIIKKLDFLIKIVYRLLACKIKQCKIFVGVKLTSRKMDCLLGPSAKDAQSLLTWWKDHSSTYHVLALLAKDFLASSGAVENTFSSAASGAPRSLKQSTIGQCVIHFNIRQKEGIQVSG